MKILVGLSRRTRRMKFFRNGGIYVGLSRIPNVGFVSRLISLNVMKLLLCAVLIRSLFIFFSSFFSFLQSGLLIFISMLHRTAELKGGKKKEPFIMNGIILLFLCMKIMFFSWNLERIFVSYKGVLKSWPVIGVVLILNSFHD